VFPNQCEECAQLPGADIDSDHNLLVDKICTRWKKIIRFQKRRPRFDLGKLYTQRQRVQGTLEEKLDAIGSESVNVEVQRNIVKEYVLDILSGWLGKPRREQENHGLHRK
jgi:hypothetical protein